ncbi:MAG TPA: PRC-barrel domain-containing protein [Myxococcota bacterium]|nr:PRC-barrel domain-containing protein [Myxococcota bacterium]
MITFRKSQGLLVVSMAEGAVVGKLDDFQFDLEDRTIYGYRIKGSGMFSKTGGIVAEKLVKVGRHVVFISSEADVEWTTAARHAEEGRAWASQYTGTRVMSRRGTMMGEVDDFVFDPEEDKVLALYLDHNRVVEIGDAVTTGPAACILDASAVREVPGESHEPKSWWSRLTESDDD